MTGKRICRVIETDMYIVIHVLLPALPVRKNRAAEKNRKKYYFQKTNQSGPVLDQGSKIDNSGKSEFYFCNFVRFF
jgi:hypothetical protein